VQLGAELIGAILTAAAFGLARFAPKVRRVAIGAAAAGACVVFCRAALGGALAPPPLELSLAQPVGTSHTGLVLSVGTPDGGQQRAVVELRAPEAGVTVYAWLPRYPQVVPQDIITFDGKLEPPPPATGFADYLARSGIELTDKARSMQLVGTDDSPLAALENIRRTANDLIDRVLPEPQAGLATAMAIGLRDVVSRDVTNDFRISGLSHVVAISGWHIAMLGAVVAGLLGGLPRRPRSLLVVIAICAYALLAGAAASILRAAFMAAAVIVARESGRRGQAKAALALTAMALLVLDPKTVSDAGFELSAVATAGLLAWASPLHGWLESHVPRHTPGWLVEALSVSLAAQAATLPLVLLQFGQLSLVAPLANLLIAPLVAPAMLVTAVCFAAGSIVAAGGAALVVAPVSLFGSLLIGAMVEIAHLCASLPFANVALSPPWNIIAAAASAGAIAFVARRSRARKGGSAQTPTQSEPVRKSRLQLSRSRLAIAGGALTMSLLLAVVAVARPDGRLHVAVMDVGQGDSILLQGPDGGRILIDTGPDPDRLLTLLDSRIPSWDRRLDLVVLTHPHEDHVGGLALLLQRYKIGDIVEPGMIGPGPGDAAYRREMAQLGRSSRVVAAGDKLWLDGIDLDVDWPPRGTVPLHPKDGGTAINNVSIVLQLRFGQRQMLFTGDVEEQIDPQLLADGIAARIGGRLDVLKVAHHGSGTATSDAFVQALDPGVAVISAGWGNPYGHPSPKTVARLQDHGAKLYRTDLDGNIDISTNGTDLVSFAEGGRPHPTSELPGPPQQVPQGIAYCAVPQAVTRQRRRHTYNRRRVRPDPRRGRSGVARRAAQREAVASFDGRGGNRGISRRGHDPPRRDA